jgi:hypothetical protein
MFYIRLEKRQENTTERTPNKPLFTMLKKKPITLRTNKPNQLCYWLTKEKKMERRICHIDLDNAKSNHMCEDKRRFVGFTVSREFHFWRLVKSCDKGEKYNFISLEKWRTSIYYQYLLYVYILSMKINILSLGQLLKKRL